MPKQLHYGLIVPVYIGEPQIDHINRTHSRSKPQEKYRCISVRYTWR